MLGVTLAPEQQQIDLHAKGLPCVFHLQRDISGYTGRKQKGLKLL